MYSLVSKLSFLFSCIISCQTAMVYKDSPHSHQSSPEEDSFHSQNIEIKPLGRLLLKCLPRTWTTRSNDGHASYFGKRPASSPLNAEGRQPPASVGSISPPSVLRSPHPPPPPQPPRPPRPPEKVWNLEAMRLLLRPFLGQNDASWRPDYRVLHA